jgi:aspartate/methionine/tyrosine aminotransferase
MMMVSHPRAFFRRQGGRITETMPMAYSRTQLTSTYMEYAKLQPSARYTLATSGIEPMRLEELGSALDSLEIEGGGPYGHPELLEEIASYYEVDPDCVVSAIGTSFANHLALAALFEPGEDVLIEQPTYEPLMSTAQFLGANIIRFQRRSENGFRIDLEDLRRNLTSRTRVIALCNLHNPTSFFDDEATLAQIGDLARTVGARVLVDEVYLEAIHPRPRSSFHLGDNFVVTSSLTKGFGLSGLRCGWILAQPELARRMWRLYDVFGGHNPYPAEALSVLAFRNLERVRERAQRILSANRPVMNSVLQQPVNLDCELPEIGTTAAPRLRNGTVDHFCDLLLEKYETSVVPGRFFEMPQHFRVGIGGDPESTRIGFERLAQALNDYARR